MQTKQIKKEVFMYLLFWGLFGSVIGISAARCKGFSIAGGIIGGFLLGPLAFLMFLCSDGKKRCNFCNEWIEKKAKICPFCTRNTAETSSSSDQQLLYIDTNIPCGCTTEDATDTIEYAVIESKRKECSKNKIKNVIFIIPGKQRNGDGDVIVYCPGCEQKFAIDPVEIFDPIDKNGKFTCPECQAIFTIKLEDEDF